MEALEDHEERLRLAEPPRKLESDNSQSLTSSITGTVTKKQSKKTPSHEEFLSRHPHQRTVGKLKVGIRGNAFLLYVCSSVGL